MNDLLLTMTEKEIDLPTDLLEPGGRYWIVTAHTNPEYGERAKVLVNPYARDMGEKSYEMNMIHETLEDAISAYKFLVGLNTGGIGFSASIAAILESTDYETVSNERFEQATSDIKPIMKNFYDEEVEDAEELH